MRAFLKRLVLCGLCLIVGCSTAEPEGDADESDRMLNVLTTALDAWKSGAADSLKERNPPIRFVDDDWVAGRRLTAYRLEDPEAFALSFESVYVTLTLQTVDGKTVERKVGYHVAVEPGLAVLRSEP